ncbi:MAG: phage gp6-like head-tail connector protein [Acholeplasmataceae bacterium]|nr:phage gp6-like head-tail connector protein [Acholeplasmataceae bacterium]
MALTLSDAKLYMRVENDVDDVLITRLMTVAEGYIRDAVTDYDKKVADAAFLAKSEMCQLVIIAELYENRNQGVKESKDYSYAVRSMITQLQYAPVPEATP